MATLRECIALHHAAEAIRPPGQRIRILRGACMAVADWQFTLHQRAAYYRDHPTGRQTQVRRSFAVIEMAEHLGLDRVGRVVEMVTVKP